MVKVFGGGVDIPEGQHGGSAKSRLAATTTLFAASFSFSELAAAASTGPADGPAVLGIPVDFILFALTLPGVALSNVYPEAKSVGRWLVHCWHVTFAYAVGLFVPLAVLGWQATPKRGDLPPSPPATINAPAAPAR